MIVRRRKPGRSGAGPSLIKLVQAISRAPNLELRAEAMIGPHRQIDTGGLHRKEQRLTQWLHEGGELGRGRRPPEPEARPPGVGPRASSGSSRSLSARSSIGSGSGAWRSPRGYRARASTYPVKPGLEISEQLPKLREERPRRISVGLSNQKKLRRRESRPYPGYPKTGCSARHKSPARRSPRPLRHGRDSVTSSDAILPRWRSRAAESR